MTVAVRYPPDFPGRPDHRFDYVTKSNVVAVALAETYWALSDYRTNPIHGRYIMTGDVLSVLGQDFIVGPFGFKPVTKQYLNYWCKLSLLDRMSGSGSYHSIQYPSVS